jgi:acetyl esterase/lipase
LALQHRRFGGKDLFERYCTRADVTIEGEDVRGWWIASPGRSRLLAHGQAAGQPSAVLAYFPGGGFVMGGPDFYVRADCHPRLQ